VGVAVTAGLGENKTKRRSTPDSTGRAARTKNDFENFGKTPEGDKENNKPRQKILTTGEKKVS